MTAPSPAPEVQQPALNTDRELWREREGDYYADSIHVTASGSIGMNCGGNVAVLPIREWHKLAWNRRTPAPTALPDGSPFNEAMAIANAYVCWMAFRKPAATLGDGMFYVAGYIDAARQAHKALSLIAQDGAASGWQPIETAPKDGTHVLACVAGSDRSMGEAFYWEGAWRTWDGENHTRTYYDPAPTHWQPLPEPPK